MNEFTQTAETTTKVELGVQYEFPGNHDVSVTFTCLPKDTEKRTSLKIQEINISELHLPSDINIATDKAYDITTGMTDGTFKYTITLPKSENSIAEVSYIEKTIEEVRTATDTLKTDDIKPVEETKTEQQDTTVKGNDIDHMTIFFVTSATDAVSFWPHTLSNSEKNKVKYSDNSRYENEEYWPIAIEWDTEYIEFTHTNTLPSNITVTGANIIFEYQRSLKYWLAPEYAKIRVWDGSHWQLLANDLWISNPYDDQSFTIPIPLTYVNTASKLNNFTYQFKLVGAPKTYIDMAVLDVTYASCGDNIVNQTSEECDGSSGVTPNYVCNSSCKLEYVPYCGDDIINGSETCDGTNLGTNPSTDFECSKTCNLELLEKKVTICHASDSQTNPYIEQEPNKSADVSGHDGHNGTIWYSGIADHPWGDIIPPFYYVGGYYIGQNWTTEGQTIWNNGCVIPPTTGTLTVVKHVVNSGAGSNTADDFSLSVTGANATPNAFSGSESGTAVTVDGSAAYSVTEGTYDHYDVSYSTNCSGSIIAGGSATCTVTNTYHPYCGDNFKDTIEQCDDGNNVDGDRCSATCQVETCNNLFFSEYIEGNSMNKTIEIYNPTASAINLTGYSVHKYTNGQTSSTQINLSGTIAPGDVFVLAHPSASSNIISQADQLSSYLDFNGNDALALKYETTIIDSIGQIGYQPPSGEWGNGLTSTEDNTLVKKCGISCGDENAYDTFDPSVQWNGYTINTFSFLGSHTPICNCGDGFVNQPTEQCDAGSANGTFCTPTYGSTCDYCDENCQTNTITGPRCGDSTIDTGEQCDDGNTTDGDRCSSTCQIETGTLRVQKTVNVADDLADWEFKLDNGSWIHASDTGVVDFGAVTTGNHTITEKTQTGFYLHSVSGCTPIKTNNNSATATVTVGQQTTCTFNNYAIPVYTGDSTCPTSAPVKKLVNSYAINSTDTDGQVLSGLTAGNYLFEATGTFVSSSGGGWKSDAGYSSNNTWSSIDTNYGINGVAPNYGAHALLADLGFGMGIVKWGAYNPSHQYNFYAASPTNPQFVIGDRWSTWYGTSWDNQMGMSDNSGEVTLNVYTCESTGTITIDKATTPIGDEQTFDFIVTKDTTTVDSFSLADEDTPHTDEYEAGHYTISETANSQWEPGDISCQSTGGISNLETHASPTNPPARVSFDLAAGGNVTCTFNNIKYGTVNIRKYNDEDNDATKDETETYLSGWNMTITGFDPKQTDINGIATFSGISQGNYIIGEEQQNLWKQTNITCSKDTESEPSPTPTPTTQGCEESTWTYDQCVAGPSEGPTECYGNIQDFCMEQYSCVRTGMNGIWSCPPQQPALNLPGIKPAFAVSTRPDNEITVNPGDIWTCEIGNHYSPPVLQISKSNNAITDQTPGAGVLYTMTIKALDNNAYGVKVTDLLPQGFVYRSGSWTASSNVHGALSLGEPTYHSPGTWSIGTMNENEEITLTLLADVSVDEKPGLYKDLALAYGCQTDFECTINKPGSVIAEAVNPGQLNTTFVGTEVNIVKDQQDSKTLAVTHEEKQEGSVLGATTDLPSTGANANWILLAISFMVTGLGAIIVSTKMRRYHA